MPRPPAARVAKSSLLSRYSQRLGAMVDRRDSQLALEAARREAELAARNAQASSRAKSEFLANMSHSLHTPLSTIIGFAEIMERELKGPLAPAYRDYARSIAESGRLLDSMVGDVLDMSAIETGRYRLTEAEVDVADTVNAVFRLIQGRAAAAGLFLQARLPKDLPRLYADAHALKQVVTNLVTNAIKFTKPGGHIYVLPGITEDGDFDIKVVDTGIGIDPSELDRVVLPFERIGDAMTRRQQGAGLGLAFVNALMRLHGGTLALQSKLGVGTIATVTFPRDRVGESAPADAPAEAAAAPAPPPGGTGR